MVSVINGVGNAWGQIKKVVDPIVAPILPTPAPQPVVSDTAPAPTTPVAPSITATDSPPAVPLTYSAGPRQVDTAMAAPRATLDDRLNAAGFYPTASTPVAASAVADPTTQAQEDKAAQTQSQVTAQAAYAMVARAETSNREDLIQQG